MRNSPAVLRSSSLRPLPRSPRTPRRARSRSRRPRRSVLRPRRAGRLPTRCPGSGVPRTRSRPAAAGLRSRARRSATMVNSAWLRRPFSTFQRSSQLPRLVTSAEVRPRPQSTMAPAPTLPTTQDTPTHPQPVLNHLTPGTRPNTPTVPDTLPNPHTLENQQAPQKPRDLQPTSQNQPHPKTVATRSIPGQSKKRPAHRQH
jgi:hypothetical protein